MLYSAAIALPPPTSLALGHLPHRTICGRGGWGAAAPKGRCIPCFPLSRRGCPCGSPPRPVGEGRDDRKGRPYALNVSSRRERRRRRFGTGFGYGACAPHPTERRGRRSLRKLMQKSGRTEKSVRPLYFGYPPVEGKKARRSRKE